MSAPCPVCDLPGGFHDRDVHPVEVPVGHLLAGSRRDVYLMEQARKDPATAAMLDEYWQQFEDLFWGREK